MKVIVLILLFILLQPVAKGAMQPNADNNAVTQVGGESVKRQVTDSIKDIFRTKQDEQQEQERITFGIMIVQLQLISFFGWLISFMADHKIAALIRGSTVMACIQLIAEYVTVLYR